MIINNSKIYLIAIDLDGKEDMWINTMIFANGAKTQAITWKNEYNENTLKKNISENLGIPEWAISNEGVFASEVRYDENYNIASVQFHQVMPVNIEGTRKTKGGGVSGVIANYLEGIMPRKNYAGKEGLKNLGKDVLRSSEKLGDAGFIMTLGGYGALVAGMPEIGIPLIEAGEALGTAGDIGEVGNAFIEKGMYEGIGEGVKKGMIKIYEKKFNKFIDKLNINKIEKKKLKTEMSIGSDIIEDKAEKKN